MKDERPESFANFAKGVTTEEKEEDWRPDPSKYRAFGHPRRQLVCLHVYLNAEGQKVHGKKKVQLQYVHLDTDDKDSGLAADGQSFSVVFAGSVRQRITVRGRNLESGYDFLTFHRMPWIRAADRDFTGEDADPVITSIEIETAEEAD